ncbi:lysophospholipid acyltransferase family protein [Pedobacter nototheniae]|uniref:lysophospholipid acyltransferase family protein n=1 Tax=Pedobacter nototheniae TaxID=2488994 RepID=UPI00292F24AC|nr:lysophospholipid acyltransferase family protein [Pedobacter nototheniae]
MPIAKFPERMLRFFAFWTIYTLLVLISLLPVKFLKNTLGKILYKLCYSIFRYRYPVIIQNLSRCFPEKSYEAIKQTASAFYVHLSVFIIETVKLFSVSKKEMLRNVEITNPEIITYYYQQKRDVIVMLGHYGNWEYLNILPGMIPYEVNAIYKPLTNKVMGKLIYKLRTRFGMQMLPASRALRILLRKNNKPRLTLFLADQFPGADAKCILNFMNQPTNLFTGAEKLAKVSNSVVLYLEIINKHGNGYEFKFSLITDCTERMGENEITQSFICKLEERICSEPAQWLWSHRRWK